MPSPAISQSHIRHRTALAILVFALIVAAIGFSSGSVSSQGGDPQRRDLDRVFSRHERLSLDSGQVARQVKQTRSLTLTTSRGTFEMTLEPYDIRTPGYVAEAWGDKGVTVLERTPVRTYKGTVRGLPEAQARMTIDEGTVEGLIVTPGELFFLEPSKRFSGSAAKTDFVFYAASDVKESAGECGNTMAEMVEQHSANVSNKSSAKSPQPEAVFGPAIGDRASPRKQTLSTSQDFGSSISNSCGSQNRSDHESGGRDLQRADGFEVHVMNTRVWTTVSDPYTSPVSPATTLTHQRRSTIFGSTTTERAACGERARRRTPFYGPGFYRFHNRHRLSPRLGVSF